MNKKLLSLPFLALILSGCNFINVSKVEKTENKTEETQQKEDNPNINPEPEPINTIKVQSIAFENKNISIEETEEVTLIYTILPENAENKSVEWHSTDSSIASVDEGIVKGWNTGKVTITVTTIDGGKTDTCFVTVNKKENQTKEYVDVTYDFNEQGYTEDNFLLVDETITFETNFSLEFKIGTGTNAPKCYKYNKKYAARLYPGNTVTVSSEVETLTKITLTFVPNRDNSNPITCDVGSYDNGIWKGSSKEVTFSVGGTSNYRAISAFTLTYKGTIIEEETLNLGIKKISEVKEYIRENPIKTNSFGNGVNEKRYVTIKCRALAKIDLEKSTAAYGLNVSEHGKVIVGDDSGCIGVATKISNDGKTLWGKIGSYVLEQDSKYIITGYISEYLGNPEILVTTFQWDKTIGVGFEPAVWSQETTNLAGFYEKAKNISYNCAGHGYGEVITLNNLSCYYSEADGQGKRYYNFTDGTNNIRVNAYNLSSISVGHVYNVTGIISLKNLSPIVVAFAFTYVKEATLFEYEPISSNITISELRNIHGSQEDTMTRYPNVIDAYGNFYKTTGYLVAVEENGKLYVGISDTYQSKVITGKVNAKANYNVVLIKNENFWNTTEEELYLFNPYYDEYLMEEKTITVYYTPRQLSYSENKAMWEILLIPTSIPDMTK